MERDVSWRSGKFKSSRLAEIQIFEFWCHSNVRLQIEYNVYGGEKE